MPFGTTAVRNGNWTLAGSGGTGKVAGLLGGSAVVANTFGANAALTLFSNYATLFTGFRWIGASSVEVIHFIDGATVQCGLSVDAFGRLFFWRGTTATVLATGSTVLIAGGVYWIEVAATINNVTGSFTVSLGGAVEFTAVNQNTRTTANNQVNNLTWPMPVNPSPKLDDVYVNDDTGPAPYNTFLGVIRVETLFMTVQGSVAWVPKTSTNLSQIQEVNMDSDTTYNVTPSAAIDEFTHGALSSTPITIFAVDVISSARKDDVKAVQYRNKLISGATTANGATNSLATVYQYVRDSYQTDPNTGAPWAAAAVNATTIGYERF
jgi:hypothetical protein